MVNRDLDDDDNEVSKRVLYFGTLVSLSIYRKSNGLTDCAGYAPRREQKKASMIHSQQQTPFVMVYLPALLACRASGNKPPEET